MFNKVSKEYSYIPGKVFDSRREGISDFPVSEYKSLRELGMDVNDASLSALMNGQRSFLSQFAADAIQADVSTPSTGALLQFLQQFLPGAVLVTTAARKIDDIIGINIVGDWEDEQIVQQFVERTGNAALYDDYSNTPLASYNVNYVYRTVVRFEEGIRVGKLEAARMARQNVAADMWKREAAIQQLEIQRNQVGFVGYANGGNNNTYGYLNDPNLSSFVTVATGASSSTLWSSKTFLEICADIRTAIQAVQNNSLDVIDPEKVDLTLAVATASVVYLSKTSDFGISVRDWLRKSFPRVRVVSAPQLNSANGGSNVFYLHADRLEDNSTDGGQVWVQAVPMKFKVLGVQNLPKGYEESFSNATSGAFCKRPFAVVRYSGI